MSAKSSIEWTGATWTPLRARVKDNAVEIAATKGYTSLTIIPGKVGPHCEHASTGCLHCYSETNNGRCLPSNGTGLPFDRRARDLVDTFLDEKILAQPISWRVPRKVFVCSQTDLFGEWVPEDLIDRVFAVMAQCRKHTFQVLTKRPEKMREYLSRFRNSGKLDGFITRDGCLVNDSPSGSPIFHPERWPLPNVWLGVSVEDQQRADERIPHLLQTPAAVRFLSVEPLLGRVDVSRYLRPMVLKAGEELTMRMVEDGWSYTGGQGDHPGINWLIIGGESGPGARVCDLRWIRSLMEQCAAAEVACFVKQFGAHPMDNETEEGLKYAFATPTRHWVRLKDKKGSDMSEWPERYRVRQMPGGALKGGV